MSRCFGRRGGASEAPTRRLNCVRAKTSTSTRTAAKCECIFGVDCIGCFQVGPGAAACASGGGWGRQAGGAARRRTVCLLLHNGVPRPTAGIGTPRAKCQREKQRRYRVLCGHTARPPTERAQHENDGTQQPSRRATAAHTSRPSGAHCLAAARRKAVRPGRHVACPDPDWANVPVLAIVVQGSAQRSSGLRCQFVRLWRQPGGPANGKAYHTPPSPPLERRHTRWRSSLYNGGCVLHEVGRTAVRPSDVRASLKRSIRSQIPGGRTSSRFQATPIDLSPCSRWACACVRGPHTRARASWETQPRVFFEACALDGA